VAELLASAGHETVLVCRAAPGLPSEEQLGGARLIRVDMDDRAAVAGARSLSAPLKIAVRANWALRNFSRRLGWPEVARFFDLVTEFWAVAAFAEAAAAKLWDAAPDALHASGLAALTGAGRLSRLLGSALVYDAIELERGRNARYFPPYRLLRLWLERRWIARTDACATVSPEIARQLARDYGVATPAAIPNVGPYSETPPGLRSAIGAPAGAKVAVYIGAAVRDRGLIDAIRALASLPDFRLAVIGPQANVFADRFAAAMDEAGVRDRVHAVPPTNPSDVAGFVADADVAVICLAPSSASYIFALPNKLYQAVGGGLPVVVGRTAALRRVVRETEVGEAVDETDADALAEALGRQAARRPTAEFRAARARFLSRFGATAATSSWASLYALVNARRDARHNTAVIRRALQAKG